MIIIIFIILNFSVYHRNRTFWEKYTDEELQNAQDNGQELDNTGRYDRPVSFEDDWVGAWLGQIGLSMEQQKEILQSIVLRWVYIDYQQEMIAYY